MQTQKYKAIGLFSMNHNVLLITTPGLTGPRPGCRGQLAPGACPGARVFNGFGENTNMVLTPTLAKHKNGQEEASREKLLLLP